MKILHTLSFTQCMQYCHLNYFLTGEKSSVNTFYVKHYFRLITCLMDSLQMVVQGKYTNAQCKV